MTSETTEKAEILKPEEYAAMHKAAFRVAFDFLNAHFPPGMDKEYWLKACDDITEASASMHGDVLTNNLLAAVYSYIESEYFLRRKAYEQIDA